MPIAPAANPGKDPAKPLICPPKSPATALISPGILTPSGNNETLELKGFSPDAALSIICAIPGSPRAFATCFAASGSP